jgi:hypothetical protein
MSPIYKKNTSRETRRRNSQACTNKQNHKSSRKRRKTIRSGKRRTLWQLHSKKPLLPRNEKVVI